MIAEMWVGGGFIASFTEKYLLSSYYVQDYILGAT